MVDIPKQVAQARDGIGSIPREVTEIPQDVEAPEVTSYIVVGLTSAE